MWNPHKPEWDNGIVEVTKDIYVHVPPPWPEETLEAEINGKQVNRKHYKIIFIKAPSLNVQQQLEISRKSKQEEKTIVYVLVKKPTIDVDIELENKDKQKSHKPEVYFIKYKTKENRKTPHDHWDHPTYGPPKALWDSKK